MAVYFKAIETRWTPNYLFSFFFFFFSKLFHTHTHTQNIQLGFCPNADTCFFLQILKIYHRKVSLFSGQLWLV